MANLINSIFQIKEFINVGAGLSIETIRPALNEVEMQELTFYLGTDLLTEMIAQVNSDPQNMTARIYRIRGYVLAACANLAIYKGGPEIEVLINDNGILRQETANEKTAFGGQVKRVLDMAADRGYKSIDSFLRILETNVADYPEWLTSEYYAGRQGLMIRSAQEFEAAGENIKGSALTFQSMRHIIRDIQAQRIAMAINEEMYQDLLDNPTTEPNKLLLEKYIRPALAKLTIEEALKALPVNLDHESVTINQIALQGDARTKTNAPIHLLEKKAWGLRGRGEFYINMMKEFLNQNASLTAYPLWFNSDNFSITLKARIERDSLPDHERKIYRG